VSQASTRGVVEVIGLLITVVALLILAFEILYVGLFTGSIGLKGEITVHSVLTTIGWLLLLVGPALWLGGVPVNIKKMVEARTGRKLS